MQLLVDQLASMSRVQDPTTQEVLEIKFRDSDHSNRVVMLLRFITSCEIQQREDFFLPFILVSDIGSSNPVCVQTRPWSFD